MIEVRLFQFQPGHSYAGCLYFVDQMMAAVDGRGLEKHVHMLHSGEEFRTWCYDHRITIHGEIHNHHARIEYIALTEDQRFEFKMRWGY